MNAEGNPFQPPQSAESISSEKVKRSRLVEVLKFLWPILFGANMVIPLMAGMELLDVAGFYGVALATLLLLVSGWSLFVIWPALAVRVSAGSIVTALLQFFPILHFVIGIIAFSITVQLGHASDFKDDSGPKITSEVGGFLITFIMGSILLFTATGIGTLLLFIVRSRDNLVSDRN